MPPHPALSHRNLRGSAERSRERTRRVPGERGREQKDVLKQPEDVYLGDELQANPKSKDLVPNNSPTSRVMFECYGTWRDPYAPSPCPLPPELEGECGAIHGANTQRSGGEG